MNRKIRRVFSIILVACMLLSLVPLHATSLNESGDLLSSELVDEELSTNSNAEESSTESTLSSEQEISSSTVSNNDAEEIKISDETESSLSSDSDEEIAEQQDILTMADEETEKPENDNWELGLVFYDSTVDNGKTPLTEINWDASDGGYEAGIPRVITVQINYRNTNAITTYQPDELAISIPNLAYNASSNIVNSPYWDVAIVVGANDSTHSGYNWNFKTGVSPTTLQKTFTFTNANIIEEKSNFEGSIQIVYTITPAKETPENYLDECIHSYLKTLQASLGYFIPAQDVKSPNWPNNYNNNMTEETNFWEVSLPGAEHLEINFDSTCKLESASRDYLRFYDKDRNNITSSICEISDDKIGGSAMAGKTYYVAGDYVKITMRTDGSSTYKGFSANIYGYRFGSIITESNDIELNYTRTYIHPWEYTDYTVIKSASKISSYDGLGENASNYIWVKYNFYHLLSFSTTDKYPNINVNKGIYKDNIPNTCIVYDSSSNLLAPDENGYYSVSAINTGGSINSTSIYVGYPKSIYNEENGNLNITNEVELWGTYNNKTESELLSTNSISINLADFKFVYIGDLYRIDKSRYYYTSYPHTIRYQDIVNSYGFNKSLWYLKPTAIYSGNPMTVKIGDDLLYSTTLDGTVEKLKDDEYYFCNISFESNYFVNGNGNKISENKYDCELYVRYKDSNEYVKYGETFKNPTYSKSWTFSEADEVVGFYFMIYDMTESIKSSTKDYGPVKAITGFTKKNIPKSGTLYNFDYLQVYFKDSSGKLVFQNEPGIESYANFLTKEEIATYDKDIYGVYLQRGVSSGGWSYHEVEQPANNVKARKTSSNFTQDAESEQFISHFTIGAYFIPQANSLENGYIEQYDSSYAVSGFKLYDLLPLNMELLSSKEEIADSFDVVFHENGANVVVYDLKWNRIEENNVGTYVDAKTEVNIINNWNNTGRTKIEINCTFNNPIYIFLKQSSISFNYSYNYSISYDAFLEHGNIWENYCYVDKLETQEKGVNLLSTITDSGIYDSDAVDIDEDGDITDKLAYAKAQATITSVVSTHQDVQKQVKTDKSNYSTGKVESSYDSEYEYKLRVKTGQNDVTNLVIYDSIEEYAQDKNGNIIKAYGDKKHWNGEFLGIDTSYAESKGYVVKPYYSENPLAGNLSDDNSWVEYSDSIDKSKVKALAFEYLDAEGNPAKLPANSLTYVLIKMKSPSDENITSLAYNGCRTQWQALDDYDRPVDFITGINSNIVKVSLPNSVEDKEVNLSFNKMIDASDEDFERLKLDKESTYNFFISLTNQETGEVINGLLDSKEGFRVNNIPIGTYIIEEQNDIWFSFVSMVLMEPIEGIDFKEEDGAYIISIGASVESGATANIEVTNKPDEERFYDSKYDIKNLFTPTM